MTNRRINKPAPANSFQPKPKTLSVASTSALSPAELTAVDELCHILARVLMRVNTQSEETAGAKIEDKS